MTSSPPLVMTPRLRQCQAPCAEETVNAKVSSLSKEYRKYRKIQETFGIITQSSKQGWGEEKKTNKTGV